MKMRKKAPYISMITGVTLAGLIMSCESAKASGRDPHYNDLEYLSGMVISDDDNDDDSRRYQQKRLKAYKVDLSQSVIKKPRKKEEPPRLSVVPDVINWNERYNAAKFLESLGGSSFSILSTDIITYIIEMVCDVSLSNVLSLRLVNTQFSGFISTLKISVGSETLNSDRLRGFCNLFPKIKELRVNEGTLKRCLEFLANPQSIDSLTLLNLVPTNDSPAFLNLVPTDAGMDYLTVMPNITALTITEDKVRITDKAFFGYLANLKLVTLNLGKCKGIAYLGFADISNLTNLRNLDLSDIPEISGAIFGHLAPLGKLVTLSLRGNKGITDESDGLGLLISLTSLNLGGTQLKSNGINQLAALTNLVWLDLEGLSIDDSDIESITNLRLAYINLKGTETIPFMAKRAAPHWRKVNYK